jgi:hypothetical protein
MPLPEAKCDPFLTAAVVLVIPRRSSIKRVGELHGLAGQVYKPNQALPATYLMIYTPRTEQELSVVKQILQAAIRYSSLPIPAPPAAKKEGVGR